jgi:hypothetical protein
MLQALTKLIIIHMNNFCRLHSPLDGNSAIVEIGYGNREIMGAWASLYPSAFLYVIDRDAEPEVDGFKVLRCDQSSNQSLVQLRNFLCERDVAVILDDGSHIPEHQLITFNMLFGVLREGGVYVIEDIKCSYWRYGGLYGYPTRCEVNSDRSLLNQLILLPYWVKRGFWLVAKGFASLGDYSARASVWLL